MSLSKLSKLPPEVLSSVLNNRAIPLGRRLRLRLLSNLWCDIIEDGLKKETSLVVREENALGTLYPNEKADDLIIKSSGLTDELIQTMVRLFPSPTELTLAFGGWRYLSVSWITVPSLLAQIGTNLTTVKLRGNIQRTVAKPLARALAALSNLTSFTLCDYQISEILVPHLGPVLSRLEAFACPYQNGSDSIISSSLSPRCTRLLLDQNVFATFSGPLLSQLSASLMHLHLLECDHATVWESLSQMHRLTSLALDFILEEVTCLDSFLFRHLVPFARLTDLKLFGLVFDTPLVLPSKMGKPLSTIKRLTLKVDFDFGVEDEDSEVEDEDFEVADEDSPVDYQAFFKSIGTWFPALTKLTIIASKDTFPAIRDILGNLSFSVNTVDSRHFDPMDSEL